MRRQIINKKGFTLVEIMIALTIFSMGILGVAVMQISAIKGNASSSRLTTASAVAQGRMEELLALNYTDPLLSDTNRSMTADGTDADGTDQDQNNDGIDDNGGNFGLDLLPPLSVISGRMDLHNILGREGSSIM